MSRQETQETGRKVLLLKNKVQECVMSIGKVMADQVCASAALEHERMKLQIISAKTNVLDRSRRDAASQTEDGDELEPLERERRRLLERRAQLLEDTKGMPKNSPSMVDILKKRNAALLIREERALQRARKLRQEKQDRLEELRGRGRGAHTGQLGPKSTSMHSPLSLK